LGDERESQSEIGKRAEKGEVLSTRSHGCKLWKLKGDGVDHMENLAPQEKVPGWGGCKHCAENSKTRPERSEGGLIEKEGHSRGTVTSRPVRPKLPDAFSCRRHSGSKKTKGRGRLAPPQRKEKGN